MIGLDVLAGHTDAAMIFGIVLAEAVVLYVGYGVLTGVANAVLERTIERK